MPWKLYNEDALIWLSKQPAGSFDALVTDPPYSSGGLHASARTSDNVNNKYLNSPDAYPQFVGENRDQFSYLAWSTLWLTESFRTLKDGAPFMVFIDWRQLSVMINAVQAAGFTYRGCIAWDKTEAVRPALGRFRQQAEFVLWGSKGAWPRKGNTYPGVYRFGVNAGGKKQHTTGKPVPLMEALLAACPAGTVLDPFAGSGSTGVAALNRGLGFVGCEVTKAYYEVASERLQTIV